MASRACFRFFLAVLFVCLSRSQGREFHVGGKDGWVVNPSEDYNHWAERNRFQVNDTISFRYKKGEDSVLLVIEDDYHKCNTKNPVYKWEDGDSEFRFYQSGPFFFISGKPGNCEKGQKLIVVVLAVRASPPVPTPLPQPPAVAPSPRWPAPATPPSSPAPPHATPTLPPTSPPATPPTALPPVWPPAKPPTSPSPATKPPSSAPSPAPTATPPSSPPSSLPLQFPPEISPASAPAPAPSSAWTITPASLSVVAVTFMLII
ncbi:hypothetical protein BT93_F2607, partial [Corymbia citriodora subsp. variegata]